MSSRIIKRACKEAYGEKALSELGLLYDDEQILNKNTLILRIMTFQ